MIWEIPLAGYMHMNRCLQDQAITHGLSKDQAVRTCSKLLQDHMKRMEEQQQPTYNIKTSQQQTQANSWKILRSRIIN